LTNVENVRVVLTGAGRGFGRSLAICLAARGAEVFLSARGLGAAERTQAEIRAQGSDRVHAFTCDLRDPESIRSFAAAVTERTPQVDILVNNGARWLNGADLASAADEDIVDTLASGAIGTVLMVKHFLPSLKTSPRPDIVNVISACGVPGFDRSSAHDAFYAAKSAHAGFADILSRRLRPAGIRVISLYPPDFDNPDPLSPAWDASPRGPHDVLTAQSLVDCVLFAVGQPRDCFIRSFLFEPQVVDTSPDFR